MAIFGLGFGPNWAGPAQPKTQSGWAGPINKLMGRAGPIKRIMAQPKLFWVKLVPIKSLKTIFKKKISNGDGPRIPARPNIRPFWAGLGLLGRAGILGPSPSLI